MFSLNTYRRTLRRKLSIKVLIFSTISLIVLEILNISFRFRLNINCEDYGSRVQQGYDIPLTDIQQLVHKKDDLYLVHAQGQNSRHDEIVAGYDSGFEKQSQKHGQKQIQKNVFKGMANIHIWPDICAQSIDSLKLHPRFPFAPEKRNFLTRLQTSWKVWNYGQRIFGYLHPPVTGVYFLTIYTKQSSQLWLDINCTGKNVELVAATNWNESFGEFALVHFQKELPCYFEILHASSRKSDDSAVKYDTLKLMWLTPGQHKIEVIGKQFISLVVNDSDVHHLSTFYDKRTPISSSLEVSKPCIAPMVNYSRYPYNRSTKRLNHQELKDLFIPCNYTWEEIQPNRTSVKHYEGVKRAVLHWIYPAYNTDIVNSVRFSTYKQIENIVRFYMEGLRRKFGR